MATILKIDDREFTLAWDFSALCSAETASQVNLLDAVSSLGQLNMRQLQGLLLAFVRGGDPASTMTLAECGELIRFDTIFLITEALAAVIVATLPKERIADQIRSSKSDNLSNMEIEEVTFTS